MTCNKERGLTGPYSVGGFSRCYGLLWQSVNDLRTFTPSVNYVELVGVSRGGPSGRRGPHLTVVIPWSATRTPHLSVKSPP